MENKNDSIKFAFPEDFLFHYLYTPDKTILDAGCGLGTTTLFLCQRILAEGGTGRVISVDIDKEDLSFAKKRIGELENLVTFLNEDLESMPSIADGSIDEIYLVNTVSWLEMSPLKAVSVFSEFRRILKKGGRLSIHDQYICNDSPSIWSKAWTLYKALNHLEGKEHLVEISPEYLAATLSSLYFKEVHYLHFHPERIPKQATMNFINRLIDRCQNTEQLKNALPLAQELLNNASSRSQTDDLSLPTYVLHCRV